MNIETVNNGTQLVVTLSGDMDAAGCAQIRSTFDEIAEQQSASVIIDMGAVTFLDSSGIGAVVFLYKRLIAGNGQLALENVHGQPLELMELLRISSAIPVNGDMLVN